jgi:hypothetical protein
MNTLSKMTLAAALFASTVGYAVAQQAEPAPSAPGGTDEQTMEDRGGQGRHHGKGRHGGRHGGQMFQMIDANGDGAIGDDEAASLAERAFMRLDRDNDGTVSEAEFISPPGRGQRFWSSWFGNEEQAAVQNVRKQKFAGFDTDKNANLSKTEFFAEAKSRLTAADADKDGKVTPWEFRAAN